MPLSALLAILLSYEHSTDRSSFPFIYNCILWAEKPLLVTKASAETAIIEAAKEDIKEIVSYLANNGFIESRDKYGNTALMHTALNGHTAIAQQLINCKANCNAQNAFGETAFSYALLEGHKGVGLALLAAKADPFIKNHFGMSAIERVSRHC